MHAQPETASEKSGYLREELIEGVFFFFFGERVGTLCKSGQLLRRRGYWSREQFKDI